MICTRQKSVNFFLMPGTKLNTKTPAAWVSNLLTITLLVAGIAAVVTGIYTCQRLLYKQHYQAPVKSAAGLHKITGITADDVYDLAGSAASGHSNPMKLFDENADPANGIMGEPKTQPAPDSKVVLS